MATIEKDDRSLHHVEATPKSPQIAEELGYGKVQVWVDAELWIIREARYWDTNLNELKTLHVSEIKQVEGIWTRHKMRIENHKTGHKTELSFSDVSYAGDFQDSLFNRQSLTRGAP